MQFMITESSIKGADKGLFFKGKIGKKQKLCGYGGEVKPSAEGDHGHYTVQIWRTKYVIDARKFAKIPHKYVLHLHIFEK